MDTFLLDATWAFEQFYQRTEVMSSMDFDIDELLAGYVEYMLYPDNLAATIPAPPGEDGRVLYAACCKLYRDMDVLIPDFIKEDIMELPCDIHYASHCSTFASYTLIIRIYPGEDLHPRLTDPPSDHR